MARLIAYLKSVRAELTHVTWPSTRQVTIFTIVVIIVSALTSLYLGLFDFIFTGVLERFFF